MATIPQQWTVQQLIDRWYPTLGLPHFQRGLVWNTDAVSLLLESLYHDTPCGTFILWKPRRWQDSGEPLPDADPSRIEHLIIDGQQRIRTIHDALAGLSTDAPAEDSDGEGQAPEPDPAQQIWCLNLARLPELSGLVKDERLADKPLFVKVRDPRLPRARYGEVFPLEMLLRGDDTATWLDADLVGAVRRIKLAERVQAMRERSFVVYIKEEADGRNTLAEMVQLYNRINSGGMRVQAEERAFATLVSLYPDTNRRLGHLFAVVSPAPADAPADPTRLQRDEVLKRTRESRFGFKLFMRALVQAAAHHTSFSLGTSGLSFEIVNTRHISRHLRPDDARTHDLYSAWATVVEDVAAVLDEELCCDDFRFLPETASLVPAFQLLLQYPDLASTRHRALLALYLLKLQLAELPQRQLMKIAADIRQTNALEQCVPIIAQVGLEKLDEARLRSSNSVQDRYVLLLYWLERRRGARDFAYGQVEREKQEKLPIVEVVVDKACSPEKQHIVPYAALRKTYNLSGRNRLSTHEVNNIGNLTYISAALNSFETGLSDQPLDLDLEQRQNPDNLWAHFLAAGEQGSALLPDAAIAMKNVGSDADLAGQREMFERFCEARRALIIRGFRQWVELLEQQARFTEKIEHRTEPVPRLFSKSLADRIRELDYHNLVEDQLLALEQLARVTTLKTAPPRDKGPLNELKLCPKGRGSGFLVKLTVEHGGDILLELPPSPNPVSQAVAEHVACRLAEQPGLIATRGDAGFELDCSAAAAPATAELLRAVVEILQQTPADPGA